MPLTVRVSVTGWEAWADYLDRVDDRLNNDRHKGLFTAVNRIGDLYLANFDSEGGMVGGWKDLKEYTNIVREQQGFPAEHPILRRDGALRDAMAIFLQKVRRTALLTTRDSYSQNETAVMANTFGDSTVVIEAKGWKVSNQYDTGGKYGHPARMMWWVDKRTIFAAKSGITEWLANDVLEA